MPNYQDMHAAADRIRAATASLTAPGDPTAVHDYLRELEAIAREQAVRAPWLLEGRGVACFTRSRR